MIIEDKYVRLIGKPIYSKRLDKHGHISSMEIMSGFNCVYPIYRAYFDIFDNNSIIALEDFVKGELQFVILSGLHEYKKMNTEIIESAKSAFGEKYSGDMVMQIDHEKWSKMQKEQDKRNKQSLFTDLVSLDEISVDVFYDDFYTQYLYSKYKNGVLTETQMLYAVVNYLCCEHKRLADKNLEYFAQYDLKSCCCCNVTNNQHEDDQNEHS